MYRRRKTKRNGLIKRKLSAESKKKAISFENCEVQVRQVAGEQASDRILQDSDGVCSVQIPQDIKLTIQTLQRISQSTLRNLTTFT